MIELNKEAFDAAWNVRIKRGIDTASDLKQCISAYLEALPKPAPKTRNVLFDKDKVKPGAVVFHKLHGACKYRGMTLKDLCILEDGDGMVWCISPKEVTFNLPVETVKVALFRHDDCDQVNVFLSTDSLRPVWKQVSEWVEIEVAK